MNSLADVEETSNVPGLQRLWDLDFGSKPQSVLLPPLLASLPQPICTGLSETLLVI